MAKQSVKELGRVLPDRIRLLSSLIARKPETYTSEWASTIDDAFQSYTNTRTIDLLHCWNRLLVEIGWPFPAYLDIRDELEKSFKDFATFQRSRWLLLARVIWRGPSLFFTATDSGMVAKFRRQRKKIFFDLSSAPALSAKQAILADIEKAFEQRMWAACITTAVPLLDFIMRAFFETEKLNVTIQVLRDAFMREANLCPEDLLHGRHIWWDRQRNTNENKAPAQSLTEDLRLPGIYLSSFFEFANRYYEWYKSTDTAPRTALNRHAIMHCSSEFWTQANAVKLITFIDLTIRLEKVLRVLIHGERAVTALKDFDV